MDKGQTIPWRNEKGQHDISTSTKHCKENMKPTKTGVELK
jgi:hypothetical protein